MRKSLSIITLFFIIINLFPINLVIAADLDVMNITVNSQANSTQITPGDNLNIFGHLRNNSGETLDNINFKINFSDTTGFNYDGNVDFWVGNNSEKIPIGNFTGTGFDHSTTNVLGDTENIYFWDQTQESVSINTDATSPEVTLEMYATANKSGTSVESAHSTFTLYVDVKPHITDYYLTESGTTTKVSTIQGYGGQNRDLYVEVKDYNGCTNLDANSLTADLTALGLGNQSLTYDSCKGDGVTAVFKKADISTLNGVGQVSMPYTIFSYNDEDGNSIDATDTNFGSIDKTDDFIIDVTSPGAPNVTNIAIDDDYIGGSSELSSQISFSADQPGEYKIALDSCGQTDSAKIFQDYTAYTSGVQIDFSVNSADLAEGSNNVLACVKNASDEEGSTSFTITKDTSAPILSEVVYGNSVIDDDGGISFKCSENGTYKMEVLTPSASVLTSPEFTSLTANTKVSFTIPNASLSDGLNTLALTCRDNAGNTDIKNDIEITKIPVSPSMTGEVTLLEDNDVDIDGIDGNDIHITWNTAVGEAYSYFYSYNIYLLPDSLTLNTGTHSTIKQIFDSSVGDFTGSSTITKDSAGNNLVSGESYKAYVLILNSANNFGTAGESSSVILTGDVVQHADVVSARFINGDKLEITTDATMDTDLGTHDASLVSYDIGASNYTATGIDSVDGKKIIFNIPTLSGATDVTGSNLVLQANAIHSLGGGYNNLVNFAGTITDGITPNMTNFQNNTAAGFGNFWKGNIELAWTLSEDLNAATTNIRFQRSSGNIDATTHNLSPTPSEVTSGGNTKTINTETFSSLVCGAIYNITFSGSDTAGNSLSQATISNFGFDNCAPSIPTLNEFTTSGDTDVDFSWNASNDDSGNGPGVKNYYLEIFSGDDCGTPEQDIDNIAATSRTVSLSTGNYSWRVSARDNLDNLSDASSCSNFLVDTNVPTFSNQLITDTDLSSTTYTTTGNTVNITADITNTDINNITANLSSLTGGAFTSVPCSTPGDANITCSFVGNTVTYSFPVGFGGAVTGGLKQVQITANNTSGLNEQSTTANITLDVDAPSVGADTMTYPNGGETVGGDELIITWDTTKITDAVGLKNITLQYKGGAQGTYTDIYSGPNSGSYTWDISGLNTAADYSIKIIAEDNVGQTAEDTTDSDFSIDKNAPSVPADTVQIPNGGEITPGNTTITITWNSAGITDAGGLKANPITLQYTTNGTDYYDIATDLANSGSYNWTVPNINVSSARVKLIAEDAVGNTSEDTSDATFNIDSILPTVSLSFAGGGGTTPSSSSYLNNTGIDISGTSSDVHMDKVVYIFYNSSDDTYYDGANYVAGEQEVTICSDGSVGGTDNSCDTISTTINPLIETGKTYTLKIRSIDEAGNKKTSSTATYNADLDNPNIAIDTTDNSYISSSLNITGTASDALSGLSSVKVQIKRNSDNYYYDGANFVNSLNSLNTTTSDSYANWSYNFTVPAGDSEGETYEIKAISYDKAYKTNNSAETTINIIKDSVGPVIVGGNNFITSPTSGDLLAGGDSINITWNPANITDAPSGIKANSVLLEYYDGNTYTEIANSQANSGTYNWASLPSLDSNVVRIRFTIEDEAGNTSSQLSNAFTIDSTPPTITSVETMENGISNGKINSLKVTFSEDIDDSSFDLSHFTIGNGIGNPDTLETGASSDDNIVILTFAETGTTASTPTLTYSGDSVEDLAGKKLANVGPINSSDAVGPRMLETNIYDDTANGKLDKIEIIFSENISSTTTLTGFTLNNAYTTMSLNSLSVSSDTINIALNESSNFDTSSGTLSLTLSNTIYEDGSGNLAGNFTANALVDKAPPVKVTAVTKDNDTFGNAGFGKIDEIILTMSEDVVGENLGDFSIGNLATGASVASLNATNEIITFTINETSDNNDTGQIPTITYTPGTLADSSGNNTPAIIAENVDDGVAPIVTSRETIDNNGNGQIDRIKFTFSENVDDNLGGINIDVSGYSVNSYDTDAASDNIIYALVTEKLITDTDATPSVRLTSNSTLADSSNNNILAESSFTASTDSVGPVVIGARYDEGGAGVSDDVIYLTFSEDITAGTIDTSVGGANSDFVIVNTGAFGPSSTTTINSATEVSITMGAGATSLDSATTTIGIKTAALEDSLNNPSPTQSSLNQVELSGSVVINEIMYSSNTDDQYIELKNLGNAIVDLSNWTIENAGGNGVTITIPGGESIAAGGYYLISKTTQATSSINVAPDLVDATLNLNPDGQNNLVLKDSLSTTFDSALATYPAGDKTVPKSMERRNIPGNGLVAGNWYSAESSVGFDNTTPKGTPGSANIFDSTAPTIDSYNPSNNSLLGATPTINFTYSDDIVGVDAGSSSFTIQKWNGTDSYGVDLSGSVLASSNIVASQADYILDPLDYGKYRVTFTIDDNVGNTATQIIEFYVDEFTMTVTTSPIDIGDLEDGNLVISSSETTITITTLGAGFTLTADKSGTLASNSSTIIDWDGNSGFGIDIDKNEDGSISNYDGNIVALNNVTLGNIVSSVDPNGNLKTYTYKIKYGAKINTFQTAGIYNTTSTFTADINY